MNISAIIQLVVVGALLLFLLFRYLLPAIFNDMRGKSSIVRPDTPYSAFGKLLIIIFGICQAIYYGYWAKANFQSGYTGTGWYNIFLLFTVILAILLLLLNKRSGAVIALANVSYTFVNGILIVLVNIENLIESLGLFIGLFFFYHLFAVLISYIMGRYIYSGYNYLERDGFSEICIGYDVSRRIPLMMVIITVLSLVIFVIRRFLV